MEYVLAVTLFAISASVTPGPNNILVMTSGVNFGVKRSLPLLTGICVGFAVMLLLVGLGFSFVFSRYPSLHFVIKCLGVLYLLYLAFVIACSSAAIERKEQHRPLSFINGALFQWVNGKAWVVASGAIAAFTSVGGEFSGDNIVIVLTFLLVSFPCVGVWLMFGSMLKNLLNTANRRRWFNLAMALLLVLSVIPVLKEIVTAL
ncbi:transporter, LysE family [Pseudoalteromonas sp. SW0106-04]|uniref:LysE family translocator n=1 Tax=Pseudoalteromonas sp. SW0106-04 TaxID=1702169 RepID=UPI0006B4B534|nr:LysE family translocator [Pseudoalteromonas sp. SW0106-04]GAP76589.1 transporter, LysE family [Pseudoalteromonas sp. SW0106-04]